MSLFLKAHQGWMERFLALAQPGYKPLQVQVKIPEQKWVSFTISLKRVPSDKGIRMQVLSCSQISSFTVNQFYPARSNPHAGSHQCHQCQFPEKSQGINTHHPLLTQNHSRWFQEFAGSEGSRTNQRETAWISPERGNPVQPTPRPLRHEFQGREKHITDLGRMEIAALFGITQDPNSRN